MPPAPDRVDDLGRRHRVGDHDGEILADGRERRERDVLDDGGSERRDAAEVDRPDRDAVEIPRGRHQRMQLAEEADPPASRDHRGGAAGVQERVLGALGRPLDAEPRRAVAPQQRLCAEEEVRGQEHARGRGAPRRRRGTRLPTRRARAPTRRAPRCGRPRRAATATGSGAASTATPTAGSRSESVRRIGCSAGRRRRSSTAGSAKVQPAISQRPRAASASSARRRRRWPWVGRPATPVRGGSVAGSRSEALDPRDLLDQVDLAGHVAAAKMRHRRPQRLVDLETERGEDLAGSAPRGSRAPSTCSRRAGRRVIGGGSGPGPPTSIMPGSSAGAAQLDEERARDDLPLRRREPGEPLLETPRGLAAPAERDGGALHRRAVPRRGLEQHARRARPDLQRAPPITPASEVGPSSSQITTMPSESVSVVPSSASTVSPARARRTVSCAACDAVEVERVHRLAGEEHHVVGDVDDVGDRPHAGGEQARREPQRRGRDRDRLEDARGETRAQIGALDGDTRARRPRAERPRIFGPGRRRERRAGHGVGLARDAVDREVVRPVGGDLELDHVGAQRQHARRAPFPARARRRGP